jgi:hypothetical protein
MFKWLSSIFLLLSLMSGAMAGAHLTVGRMESGMQMMKCCKAVKEADKTPDTKTAQLCCLINCPNPNAPAPSSIQLNFSPTLVVAAIYLAAFLLKQPHQGQASVSFAAQQISPRKLPPKYILFQSLLI